MKEQKSRVYEDIVFDTWFQEPQDNQPWAVICHECSKAHFDDVGWGGTPSKDTECCIEGCHNKAETFITLVDSYEM